MKKDTTLPLLTIGHFSIDFACLYFYLANFPQNNFVAGIGAATLYNFLAFALQAPIGYFFDRFPAKHSTFLGILFVSSGYFCGICRFPVIGLLLCGCGNAFYHVGGSIAIARTDKTGLRNSGIFVSAGALGVSLGTYLATKHPSPELLFTKIAVGILLLLILLLLLQNTIISKKQKTAFSLPAGTTTLLLFSSLLAVFLRALGGLFFPASYKELFALPEYIPASLFLVSMASGITAFLGKFLGGFLSILCNTLLQKFFPQKNFDLRSSNYVFGTITLLLSTLLFAIGSGIPVLCFFGILCFHAAMPVTLFELYCILPDRPGFAMGLSTVMLFLGYLPYDFLPLKSLPSQPILFLLSLAAAGCMFVAFRLYHKATTKL